MRIRCLVCKASGYSEPQEMVLDVKSNGHAFVDAILAIANKFEAEYNEEPELSAIGMVVFPKANVKYCGIRVM